MKVCLVNSKPLAECEQNPPLPSLIWKDVLVQKSGAGSIIWGDGRFLLGSLSACAVCFSSLEPVPERFVEEVLSIVLTFVLCFSSNLEGFPENGSVLSLLPPPPVRVYNPFYPLILSTSAGLCSIFICRDFSLMPSCLSLDPLSFQSHRFLLCVSWILFWDPFFFFLNELGYVWKVREW